MVSLITSYTKAESAAVRVSGPIVPRVPHRLALGAVETRPRVGFRPMSPQQAAGILIEPPPSPPIAMRTTSAATAAADPPLLPPVEWVSLWGLRTWPFAALSEKGNCPNSGITVVPKMIAPAARSRRTTSESAGAGVELLRPP